MILKCNLGNSLINGLSTFRYLNAYYYLGNYLTRGVTKMPGK